jgi:hypothetical protein
MTVRRYRRGQHDRTNLRVVEDAALRTARALVPAGEGKLPISAELVELLVANPGTDVPL